MSDDLHVLLDEALTRADQTVDSEWPTASDILATPAGQRLAERWDCREHAEVFSRYADALAERDAARADAKRLADALRNLISGPADGGPSDWPAAREALRLHDEQEPGT